MISKDSEAFYRTLLELVLQFKHTLISLGESYGLTSMQSVTLVLVEADGGKPMSSFCKLFSCDASNMTGIVDGLEQKKLVVRTDHPTDRRIKVITLLPKGRKIKAELMEKLAEANDGLLANLSSDEQKQFKAIIQKLAR